MVFGITFVNILLKLVLRIIIKHERRHDKTEEVVSTTFLLFIVTYINTAVLLLLININLDFSLPSWFPLFSGDYEEFDVGWYNTIGSSIIMTMIIGIVQPHISNSFWWILAFVKRCWDRKLTCNDRRTRQVF
jgi:hypothetical protein